jgi:hypothetical protein
MNIVDLPPISRIIGYDACDPAIKHASNSAHPVSLNPAFAAGDNTGLDYSGHAHVTHAPTGVTTPSGASTSLHCAVTSTTAATIAITNALNAAIVAATPCLYCAVTFAIAPAIAAAAKNTAPSRLGPVSILSETLPSKGFLPLLVL